MLRRTTWPRAAAPAVRPRDFVLDRTTMPTFLGHHLLARMVDHAGKVSHAPSYDALMDMRETMRRRSDGRRTASEAQEASVMRQLGRYAVGLGGLDAGALEVLNSCFRRHYGDMFHDVSRMRLVLEAAGYVRPGDNLHRILHPHPLHLPKEANECVAEHASLGSDPFDRYRSCTTSNIYAIDSATTSEVDDAVGLETDAQGRERVVVYVADATVHVPIDSTLELLTARTSGTTVYLPEGVFFMLPHEIVRAATLRSDQRCRTFNVSFCIDEGGSITDLEVSVGFTEHLKRMTYEQCQDIISGTAPVTTPPSSSPGWMAADDCARIHRLWELAQRVLRRRASLTSNQAEPHITIDRDTLQVLSLEDEITRCAEARNLVAALMIAANETCSRVAQAENIPIPFRGSRPLSSVHEAAKEYVPPPGRVSDTKVPATSSAGVFARSLLDGLDRLRGVTRALYHHEPLYHNGLLTKDYCHSTSPLRRYADMLVHHQLKASLSRKRGTPLLIPIEDFQMAELCAATSKRQVDAAHTQTNSERFWQLKFLVQQQQQRDPGGASPMRMRCIAGYTHDVSASPDESRSHATRYRYRTDLFIPELVMLHNVWHNDATVTIGSELQCNVQRVEPNTGTLELKLIHSVAPNEQKVDELVRKRVLHPHA